MIRVFELNHGVFRLEMDGDLLLSLEHIVSADSYNNEQVLAVLIYSVLRLDKDNIIVKGLHDELEGKNG